jgi:hypothetical protein
MDLALRRRFNLTEGVKLDVRAEYFNVFDHPMFGLPGSECAPDIFWGFQGGTVRPSFGKVCRGSSLTNVDQGGAAFKGQSALYAVGGPRSAQFTLKVISRCSDSRKRFNSESVKVSPTYNLPKTK